MLLSIAFLASLTLTQQAPVADATPAPPTPVPARSAPAEPERVCRNEAVTGTRFSRRVCRNTRQIAEEAAESRDMLRRMQGARLPDS